MACSLMLRAVLAGLVAGVVTLAGAQPSTFRITQVFSNLDGSVQFVELTESAGMNGQHRLAGLTLTSTHNGVVKRFTVFARPSDGAHREHVDRRVRAPG